MENTYSGKLALFANELGEHISDEAMLREMHSAIMSLLDGGKATEREIRATLQRHLEAGELREESFELVQKLVDRIVLDNGSATTLASNPPDDQFSSTAIIPAVTLTPGDAGDNLQVGSVLRDRFMLLEEVEGGSMGSVYKAMDRRLAEAGTNEHMVAIKVLSPKLSRDGNALRALQQEAAKTRCLTHPNIVRFMDLDRDDELYFLVLEWLPGRSLASILDGGKDKKIDLDTALDIVSQIAAALEYAHQRGVVHADVKPGNIIITPDGTVKLFDFGIARIQQKQLKATFDPGVMQAMSPAYSSMQVLTGEEPVAADDVFSLACLAYRLIAGYRVFGPRSAAEAAEEGMEPQRLDVLGKSQWAALKKALSFSRVTRFSSPAEFVAAFVPQNAAPVTVLQEDRWDDGPQPGRSIWPYAAVLLILIGGTGYFLQDQWLPEVKRFAAGVLQRADTIGVAKSEFTQEILPDVPAAAVTPKESPVTNQVAQSAQLNNPDNTTESTVPRLPDDGGMTDIPLSMRAEPKLLEATTDQAPAASDATPEASQQAIDGDQPSADIAPQQVRPESEPGTAQTVETLRLADAIVPLAGVGESPTVTTLTMVEDGKPLVIDFVRASYLDEPIRLRVIETSFEANESPLKSGQYAISDSGMLDFAAGQHKARIEITMASNPIREADVTVTLDVVDGNYADIEFASIKLTLADDDQLRFEKSLAANTIAFAVSQVSVRESDPAAQIDLIRFNPDQTGVDVRFTIRSVTAREGEDYLDLGNKVVHFAPGQRSARILVPLIQDAVAENDEAFMLEIENSSAKSEPNIYTRIAVMIRDDDS